MRLLPSLLNANWAEFGLNAKTVLQQGAAGLHIDVMDNHFVPNLSFGPSLCHDLRNYGITAYLDVHLMASPVTALIEAFAKANVNRISFHPEASENIISDLKLIRSYGIESALALNPETPLTVLDTVYPHLDHVLLMSVKAGFGGQLFLESTWNKIKALKKHLENTNITIGIDGGVNQSNIQQITALGIHDYIVGSAIFKEKDLVAATQFFVSSLS